MKTILIMLFSIWLAIVFLPLILCYLITKKLTIKDVKLFYQWIFENDK